MTVQPGPLNLITDIVGISVGNAEDEKLLSGVTVIVPANAAVAGVEIRGGAPGTRETDAVDPSCLVDKIHAVVIAGGSVFGLAAADAVTSWLSARGTGFSFGEQPHPCPVVPAANLFDLTNGGDKDWAKTSPYYALGEQACARSARRFDLGNAGAGLGCLSGIYKGGLGSASAIWDGLTVGAIVAVNSFGSPVAPGTDRLWAHDLELDGEFGNFPRADERHTICRDPAKGTKAQLIRDAATPGQNTTIGVVATDAALTPAQARRLSIMAADGMSRALRPIHTPFDGDIVFALSTAMAKHEIDPLRLSLLGTVAADCISRSIGRAICAAKSIGGWSSYREQHAI